ncbi:MAG: SHOCT domain-containing protein [Akkermansiaceae bacterium]|nr:SHOCT domain-containing protein [Akkermansiaceae bacterium]
MGCGTLLVVSLIFGVIMVTCLNQGGGGSRNPTKISSPASASLPPEEVMLAKIDAGYPVAASDPRVARFRSLLAFLRLGIPELLIILVIGGGLLVIVVAVIFGLVKANTKTPPGAPPPLASSREIRLKELESLRSQSLITEEEYRARRQKVLDEL